MKKKMMLYAGERWRAFKANLSKHYIFEPCGKNALEQYPYLEQETWDLFVLSRLDPAFQVNLYDFFSKFISLILLSYVIKLSSNYNRRRERRRRLTKAKTSALIDCLGVDIKSLTK